MKKAAVAMPTLTTQPSTAEVQPADPIAQEIDFARKITERAAVRADARADACPSCPPPRLCCAPPPPRAWNLTLLTAYEYDSNLASAPRFEGLGDEVLRDDSRWVTAAFGEYRVIQTPGWNVGLIGSAFANFHFDFDQFDVQDYMGGAYTNKALGCFIAGMRYEYHETLLGGDHLASDHRLVPNLTYAGSDWGHTTVYYEFDTAASNAPALIPAQIQSGAVNAVGLTQAVYILGGQGRLYGGYRYQNADTDGDDFDRDTQMVTGRVEVPFWQGLIGDAEVRYFWDDYANPNSLDFFDRPRYDERLELRSGLQRNFNAHWSLRLDYTYIDSDSNVENLFGVRFFEYNRHIVSSQVIYDF